MSETTCTGDKPNDETRYQCYGFQKPVASKTDPACLAYMVENDGEAKYYAKVAQFGPYVGTLQNPNATFARPEDSREYDNNRGKARYEYKRVPEDVFSFYVRFLKTANEANWREASRIYEGKVI